MKSVSYSRIIYTLLLLSLGHVVAAQTTKTSAAAQYENAIIRAEQFMDQRNYRQAKAEYENALKIDISASYPRMKLQQIKQFYSDTQDETRYNQFIKQGDQFFSRQDYDKAHEQYEWALIMKPTENYPQGRIKELEEAKILLLQKRNAYSRSVAIADSLYAKKDYRQAINEYLYASGLLPTETYPRKKIDELNKIFDSARKELNTYDQAIADADQAYMIQDYFSALAGYRKALKMRPYESYPANMIQRISDAQADKLTAEETFAKLLATADQLFASSDYATARLNYEQALRLKPAETHPKKRITEIEIIFAKRAETAESLAKALELGEQHFEKKEYAQALSQFETAKKLDANNIVAGERISTIRDILKQTADFESIVNQADNLFNESAYADARKKYEEALLKRPGHTHSATRIAEIDAVLAYLAEQEQTYQQAITRADVANKAKEYQTALTQYRLAGSIKPDESYPILQISSINAFLQQEDDNRKAFEAAISKADQQFSEGKYQQAIVSYQEALSLNTENTHARRRIDEARSLISQAETDAAYEKALAEARFNEDNKRLVEAWKAYQAASSLKPNESLPKEKMAALGAILEAEKRRIREVYEKAIANGNRYYESKVFDQAIEAYQEAASLMPDVPYPNEMIEKIRKYIEDRLLADLVSEPVMIAVGDEKKFSFQPVEMRVRRNTYVIIKINFESTEPSRFFLNYGLGDQRSGGIVMRNPGGRTSNEFLIRVSAQDRWYRVDNNWLSIFAEGTGVSVTQLRISAGD